MSDTILQEIINLVLDKDYLEANGTGYIRTLCLQASLLSSYTMSALGGCSYMAYDDPFNSVLTEYRKYD